jgi:hypothetical protein
MPRSFSASRLDLWRAHLIQFFQKLEPAISIRQKLTALSKDTARPPNRGASLGGERQIVFMDFAGLISGQDEIGLAPNPFSAHGDGL